MVKGESFLHSNTGARVSLPCERGRPKALRDPEQWEEQHIPGGVT